jgi:hypothetical protein
MTRTVASHILAAGTALALSLATPIRAQEAFADKPPDFGDARYNFHLSGEGYLRLDLHSGEVAACNRRDAGWTCVLVPDEHAAFDREIARLQRENALLKEALLSRGVPLPNGAGASAPVPPATVPPAPVPPQASAEPPPVPPLPIPPRAAPKADDADRVAREDAEIDRMMNVMERVWRRLVEMMMNLQRDTQKKG